MDPPIRGIFKTLRGQPLTTKPTIVVPPRPRTKAKARHADERKTFGPNGSARSIVVSTRRVPRFELATAGCAQRSRHHELGVIRTYYFGQPEVREGLLLAPIANVLRHLGTDESVLWLPNDRIKPTERVELAVEHALRDNLVAESDVLRFWGGNAGAK